MLPSFIHLYNESNSEVFEIGKVKSYLKFLLPSAVIDVRQGFDFGGDLENAAKEFASMKVRSVFSREIVEPSQGEIEYEKRRLSGKSRAFGLLYDGFRMSAFLRRFIRDEECNMDHAHILFTDQLIGSWGEDRHHARAVVCGFPGIVSLTGIVEAPAKPREYYALKQHGQIVHSGIPPELLAQQFADRILTHGDPRITEAAKGYALQAIFWQAFPENGPFCDNPKCRLYNAHWQSEVIEAQVNSGKLCEKHAKMLQSAVKQGVD